ncbi:MAG TPA: type II CAAX endopeptidase family protein [Pirellulales bacterium]|nr:type II CAAX endopeptidase family protein [Pirellulales bacterium]
MSDPEQDGLLAPAEAIESDEASEDSPLAPSLESGLSRRQLAWKTAAVLALAILPAWYFSFSWLIWGDPDAASVVDVALSRFVHSLQFWLPVCYLISRSGEGWSKFGFARPRWLLDPLLAVGVWMCDVVFQRWVIRMASRLLAADQFEALFSHSNYTYAVALTPGEHVLQAASLAASSFTEELVMRGYLLRRFEQLFRSTWLSVLFTSVLFAGYHTYQGPGGTVHAFVAGLTYAGAFCLFRRLWPVVIAHTLGIVP